MSVPRIILAVLLVVAALLPSTAVAWETGDVVPLLVTYRINKTTALHPVPLPQEFNPRFAVDRVVSIPTLDFEDEFQNVAIRFELSRGMRKQTRWMRLKRTQKGMKEVHLSHVTFRFGFMQGSFSRFTSFRVFSKYSPRPHASIQVKYEWDEHRAFNSHYGMLFCCVASIAVAVYLSHKIVSESLKMDLGRKMVVRDRKD